MQVSEGAEFQLHLINSDIIYFHFYLIENIPDISYYFFDL